ncbi:HAMP domain-containing sensor histidine kinase [Eubacterium sp.]|uniref:HAMP domain-containing sensor histidine kinase n=1 Tax=Eubacterium sp. TaxID=142586 RepID=UPI002FC97AFB
MSLNKKKEKQPMKLYTRIALTFTIAFTVLLVISYLLVFYFSQQIIFNENRANLIKFSNYIINVIDENKQELMGLSEEKRLDFVAQKVYPYMKDNGLMAYQLMDSNGQLYASTDAFDSVFSEDNIRRFNIDLFKLKVTNAVDLPEDVKVDSFSLDGSEYYYLGSSYTVSDDYTIYIQVVKNLDDSMMFMTILYVIQVILMCVSVGGIILLGIYGTKRSLKPLIDIADTAKKITENNLNIRIKETGNRDELDQMIISLNQMISQLESAFEMQKRFVSDASHELRVPLTVIQGYTDILKTWGQDDPEVTAEAIHSISSEVTGMKVLVEDLLTLSRLENRYYCEGFECLDMSSLLMKQIEEWQMIDADHEIRLGDIAPCKLRCNKGLMIQAIRGVIDNSVKYTPAGGTITLSCTTTPGECTIKISDTGIGIPPEAIPNLRKRFFRVDSDRSRMTGGSGLGLSIIDNILALHHGTLRIESTLGQGTTVSLCLPFP